MTAATSTKRAQAALNQRKIMELVASGQTIGAAARALDIPEYTAKRLFGKEMARVLDDHADIREAVFAEELENLRMLRRAIMPRALKGEPRAVEVALAVGRDFRSVLGMDQALKVDVTVKRVDEAVDEVLKVVDAHVDGVTQLRRIDRMPESA
jgi:hypothetical protein